MVDEEKTTIESPEGDEQQAPKKSSKKLILFGGIGLGVVVIGVALALFVIMPMMSGDKDTAETEQVDAEEAESHGAEAEESDSHGGSTDEGSMAYAINEIVVNPAGTGGSRYLSVSFGFEFGTTSLRSKFQAREAMVRDALISILSSKTVAQLTDAKQKEIMRYQIKKRLSKLLKTKKLEAVYYTDFVLQ